MKFNKYKNWNEFSWEKELRAQENCISTYISELDNYVDLPNESELILKKLENKKLLSGNTLNRNEMFFEEKDINESFFLDSHESRNNVKLFSKLGTLASEFNMLLAKQSSAEIIFLGLKVISYYGKLISNFLDFIDIEEDALPSLKAALSKRIIFTVNNIIGELQGISKLLIDNKKDLDSQINELLFVREVIIDFRYKCRTTK
jgi:hypothetical protein